MNDMVPSKAPFLAFAPENWSLSRVKFLADKLYKGSGITKEDVLEDGNTPCVRYGEIYSTYNQSFTECRSKTDVERIDSPRFFEHNDILFAGTGELIEEIGKSVVYTGEERCMAGGDIIVMQHSQEPRFLNYLFNCAYVQAQKSHDKYKLKVVHISDTSIGNMKVYMPDLGEQTIIADYLDSKCAAIDEAIERHKKIIEKLETFRHYMISHVVMHGLTNVEEKKFAPFDTCPKHWGVSRLKFVADVVRGGSPRPIDDYITDGEGYNWVKIGDATGNGKYITAAKQKITEAGLSKTRLVRPGTLLLTNSMSFGHPYVLNIDGCIHDGWLAFSNYKGIDQDYLYYFLMSESAMIQFVRTVEGSVVNNLNIEKVKNSLISIPPLPEQQEIVRYLEKQNRMMDEAVIAKNDIIKKLEEYRKSIIYQAVTGKIDCREKA